MLRCLVVGVSDGGTMWCHGYYNYWIVSPGIRRTLHRGALAIDLLSTVFHQVGAEACRCRARVGAKALLPSKQEMEGRW